MKVSDIIQEKSGTKKECFMINYSKPLRPDNSIGIALLPQE
jgi:hypothetical protein